jgi:hypothetical protein
MLWLGDRREGFFFGEEAPSTPRSLSVCDQNSVRYPLQKFHVAFQCSNTTRVASGPRKKKGNAFEDKDRRPHITNPFLFLFFFFFNSASIHDAVGLSLSCLV